MAANLVESALAAAEAATTADGGCVVPCVSFCDLSSAGPREATFGSDAYYGVLRKKMERLTSVVITAAELSDPFVPIVVFLDADVQVFRGWFAEMVKASGLQTIPSHDLLMRQKAGEALPRIAETGLGLDTRPGHGLVFQRESRKKLNSGVILAHASNPVVRDAFLLANASFLPRDYGDQSALQRAVNKKRRGTSPCDGRVDALCGLSVGMFNKTLVNAAVVDFQRPSVLVHHAHMSGRYKRKALRLTRAAKAAVLGAGAVHSGHFLDASLRLGDACVPTAWTHLSNLETKLTEDVVKGILASTPCKTETPRHQGPATSAEAAIPLPPTSPLHVAPASPSKADTARVPAPADSPSLAWLATAAVPCVVLCVRRLRFK